VNSPELRREANEIDSHRPLWRRILDASISRLLGQVDVVSSVRLAVRPLAICNGLKLALALSVGLAAKGESEVCGETFQIIMLIGKRQSARGDGSLIATSRLPGIALAPPPQ